jgi:hypothetical protein
MLIDKVHGLGAIVIGEIRPIREGRAAKIPGFGGRLLLAVVSKTA